tara:strand:+ start:371 stop:595 length:225 start_codon:yes stop_codon:yes gene_type:complete
MTLLNYDGQQFEYPSWIAQDFRHHKKLALAFKKYFILMFNVLRESAPDMEVKERETIARINAVKLLKLSGDIKL